MPRRSRTSTPCGLRCPAPRPALVPGAGGGQRPAADRPGRAVQAPAGAVASWQHAFHPEDLTEPVFSRDLLEVEILHPGTGSRLFTVFNNHLKSQFVPFDQDPVAGKQANDERRRRQAETVERIAAARNSSRQPVCGGGGPERHPGRPDPGRDRRLLLLQLVDGLNQPQETRLPKADVPPLPASGAWTHRFKETRQAGPLRAVRPDLAEPGPGRPAGRGVHRLAHPARRRRQRPYDPAWVTPHPVAGPDTGSSGCHRRSPARGRRWRADLTGTKRGPVPARVPASHQRRRPAVGGDDGRQRWTAEAGRGGGARRVAAGAGDAGRSARPWSWTWDGSAGRSS